VCEDENKTAETFNYLTNHFSIEIMHCFANIIGGTGEVSFDKSYREGKTLLKKIKEKENNTVVVTSLLGARGVDFVFQNGCNPTHVIINFEVTTSAALR